MASTIAPELDPFSSEEGYAAFRAAELIKDRMSKMTFHPFPRLPTELKLEILRWVDCFQTASPVQIAESLFALSDRSFRPCIRDIAGLHLQQESIHFPFSLYREVEQSWSTSYDSQWVVTCHQAYGCPTPGCKLADKTHAGPCTPDGIGFRYYHYVRMHSACLRQVDSFCRSELGLRGNNYESLLLLWPYLPTENSVSSYGFCFSTNFRSCHHYNMN